MELVLKTSDPQGPGVRIPLSPPRRRGLCYRLRRLFLLSVLGCKKAKAFDSAYSYEKL